MLLNIVKVRNAWKLYLLSGNNNDLFIRISYIIFITQISFSLAI